MADDYSWDIDGASASVEFSVEYDEDSISCDSGSDSDFDSPYGGGWGILDWFFDSDDEDEFDKPTRVGGGVGLGGIGGR